MKTYFCNSAALFDCFFINWSFFLRKLLLIGLKRNLAIVLLLLVFFVFFRLTESFVKSLVFQLCSITFEGMNLGQKTFFSLVCAIPPSQHIPLYTIIEVAIMKNNFRLRTVFGSFARAVLLYIAQRNEKFLSLKPGVLKHPKSSQKPDLL